MFYYLNGKRLTIDILIAIILSLSLAACYFLVEPKPNVGTGGQITLRGIALQDLVTGEILSDGDQISANNSKVDIITKSDNYQIIIDSIWVDSLPLYEVKFSDLTQWYDIYSGRFWMDIADKLITFDSWGAWQGKHKLRFVYREFNPNSGLEFLLPKEEVYTITLSFN